MYCRDETIQWLTRHDLRVVLVRRSSPSAVAEIDGREGSCVSISPLKALSPDACRHMRAIIVCQLEIA
jgi:hypothetical protein